MASKKALLGGQHVKVEVLGLVPMSCYRQLRQGSTLDAKSYNRRFICQVLDNEKSSARSREEIAQKNNINNLKTQKDGQ